jgi:hypothetical protein
LEILLVDASGLYSAATGGTAFGKNEAVGVRSDHSISSGRSCLSCMIVRTCTVFRRNAVDDPIRMLRDFTHVIPIVFGHAAAAE